LSSLNRHSVATHADVGTPKVVCLQKHAKNIVPWAKVEAMVDLFEEENADRLLSGEHLLGFALLLVNARATKLIGFSHGYNHIVVVVFIHVQLVRCFLIRKSGFYRGRY